MHRMGSLDTRKPGDISEEYHEELDDGLIIAYVNKDYDDCVHSDENANAPEHYFVHVGWREHSMVECQERRFDKCQRQRIHNLVRVPMFQIGDVG
jgi:hypothetical protein